MKTSKESEMLLSLPDLVVTSVKEIRTIGDIGEELAMMKRRMANLVFPEKEITICGTGLTIAQCPFDTETWTCNIGYQLIWGLGGHFSKIFTAHSQVRSARGKTLFNWDDFKKLVNEGVEVYSTHKIKWLYFKMYPMKRIIKKFNTEYFSNTFCYMLAYAIDKGYKKINLYGCDMMTQSEYAWEKGGIEYWVGFARGMGIKVTISEGSSLLKTVTGKPYGVKYFNMKDIDPTGSMRRDSKKKRQEPTGLAPPTPMTNQRGF